MSGFSPLGRVAESCRTISCRAAPVPLPPPPPPLAPPLRYLDLGLSFERVNEFAIRARASVVPEIDESSSLEMNDSGREGDSPAFGDRRATLGSPEVALADADRAICTFESVLGILIGVGACFRACGYEKGNYKGLI